MATLDDRKNALENKFAHDAEMQFKADLRRNKLLGLWAAQLLGQSAEDAAAYAQKVVKCYFEETGHEAVYRKLADDLGNKADEAEIRAEMSSLMVEARSQIMTEHH